MSQTQALPMTIKDICDILPHRYPFLLIDKVLDIDLANVTITAQKNLTINESFFQGHFPGAPIMPGVLILEAMAQAGGILLHVKQNLPLRTFAVLLNVKNAKFRRPAKPGDVIKLQCEGLHFSSKGGRIRGEAYVDEQLIAEAEVTYALVDKENINTL